MTEPVSRADVTDGAADLRLAPDGSPLNPLTIVDLDTPPAAPPPERLRGVVIGVGAPAPSDLGWLTAVAREDDLGEIADTVAAAPVASITLAELLALTATSGISGALRAESHAYSMLLAGGEFRAWRERVPATPARPPEVPVLIERTGDRLTLTLNWPRRHNAFGRAVRDALLDGLAIAHADPAVQVVLRGAGRSFCSGGDLDEFGTAADVAAAHLVRIGQSAALAVHGIRGRITVCLHGACMGAGIEVPSFASRIVAQDDVRIRLPELSMGLVPGAGGTVGITRRIGRWRTAYLALTGRSIDVATALDWGLVDERA